MGNPALDRFKVSIEQVDATVYIGDKNSRRGRDHCRDLWRRLRELELSNEI